MSLLILKGDRHQGADRDRAVCGLRGIDCVTFLAENREAFIVMIILITGASHTGKTVLAQKMLEKYGYPYLSIDHLKMGADPQRQYEPNTGKRRCSYGVLMAYRTGNGKDSC